MKLICTTITGKGLIFKDSSEGLTVGKSYSVFAVDYSILDSARDDSNVRFFTYNDNNEWKSYHPYFFKP